MSFAVAGGPGRVRPWRHLTRHGTVEEAACVATEFDGLDVPVLAVLGNHDHHAGIPAQVTRVIESVGITVLEGTGRADPGYGRR